MYQPEKCSVELDAGLGSGILEQVQVRWIGVFSINKQIGGFSQSLMRVPTGGDIIGKTKYQVVVIY